MKQHSSEYAELRVGKSTLSRSSKTFAKLLSEGLRSFYFKIEETSVT